MFMTVDAAAARLLRVVAVKDLHTVEADAAFEGVEGLPVTLLADDVVAGGDEVARVQANADTGRAVEMAEDSRQMLEAVADRPALPRRMLEQHHRLFARPRLERRANRLGNEPERVLLAARCAGSGMDDDAEQPERVRAIEFVDERRDRLLAQEWKRGRQVDQVAGMGDDRPDPGLVDAPAERADLRRIERLALPLAGVLAEDLQCLAAVRHRALDGPRHASGHRHVGSDPHLPHY